MSADYSVIFSSEAGILNRNVVQNCAIDRGPFSTDSCLKWRIHNLIAWVARIEVWMQGEAPEEELVTGNEINHTALIPFPLGDFPFVDTDSTGAALLFRGLLGCDPAKITLLPVP